MEKIRKEVYLDPAVVAALETIAGSQNRKTKNLMENVLISFALNNAIKSKKK